MFITVSCLNLYEKKNSIYIYLIVLGEKIDQHLGKIKSKVRIFQDQLKDVKPTPECELFAGFTQLIVALFCSSRKTSVNNNCVLYFDSFLIFKFF